MELTSECMMNTPLAILLLGLAMGRHKGDLTASQPTFEEDPAFPVSLPLLRKSSSQVHHQEDSIKAPPIWVFPGILLKMEIKALKTLDGLGNQMDRSCRNSHLGHHGLPHQVGQEDRVL